MIKNLQRYIQVEFEYFLIEREDNNFFYLIEDISPEYQIQKNKIQKAVAYIKKPSWYELHEIVRVSSRRDPYTKKSISPSDQIKDNKIKHLLWRIIDHTGEIFYCDDDFVDNMHPELAGFILRKIEQFIDDNECYGSFSKEEERKLSHDCFKYYSAIKKKSMGRKVDVPMAPAVVVLKRICEMLRCTPDEARNVSRKDIDLLFIASEQESVCQDPNNLGLAPRGTDPKDR